MSIRLPSTAASEEAPSMSADPAVHELRPEERFVDSVAQLTLHRDIDALDHSLTLSLAELLRARHVLLYKCMGDDGVMESWVSCRQMEAGHYAVRPALPVETAAWQTRLRACQDGQRPGHSAGADGYHYVWTPIHKDGLVAGALMVEGGEPFDAISKVLDGFSRIYSNYVSLIREAERDKLTGLFNRSTLDRQLQRLLERVGLSHQGVAPERLWLAILDIDHFKRVNDTYGHLYGDEVILWLAQQLRSSFPAPNALFRFGGEEFVALLLAPDEAGVETMLEQFRARMAAHVFSQIGTVTVSIGFVEVSTAGFSTQALDLADKALYYAKKHGRNQVRSYQGLIHAGALDGGVMSGSVDLF